MTYYSNIPELKLTWCEKLQQYCRGFSTPFEFHYKLIWVLWHFTITYYYLYLWNMKIEINTPHFPFLKLLVHWWSRWFVWSWWFGWSGWYGWSGWSCCVLEACMERTVNVQGVFRNTLKQQQNYIRVLFDC